MANEINNINRLLEMMQERIEDAKSPALKPNMSIVERDEMLDLLDEVRAALPIELKRAQDLLAARDKFVEEAKRDVERMLRQAELEAKSMVSETEILYAAREQARQIVALDVDFSAKQPADVVKPLNRRRKNAQGDLLKCIHRSQLRISILFIFSIPLCTKKHKPCSYFCRANWHAP
jgi:cell division septum initiation protein DivIVA